MRGASGPGSHLQLGLPAGTKLVALLLVPEVPLDQFTLLHPVLHTVEPCEHVAGSQARGSGRVEI